MPLWPQPIRIIGVTGEYGSGKTLFGVTINPPKTKVYDTEHSSVAYKSLGFTHVSIQEEMQKVKPGGYRPIDTFQWWWKQIKEMKPGEFDVVFVDTISEIEEGLVEWVQNNPSHFGHTHGQYQKMSGIMWGDVKSLWKQVLSDLAAKCETFVFAAHMANVWAGDKPTGKRKPKGKETLMEIASLYLCLERKPDDKGKLPAKPAATVLKSRLVATKFNSESGDLEIVPCLPPRLPECTPAKIRWYMDNPPDYQKLKKDEVVREETLTPDERAALELARAEAEAEKERTQLARVEREIEYRNSMQSQASRAQASELAAQTTEGYSAPSLPDMPADNGPTQQHLQAFMDLKLSLNEKTGGDETWASLLSQFGVAKARELTGEKIDAFLSAGAAKLSEGAATEGSAPAA